MTCLKQLSVTLHWGENKLLSGFLDANMRKFWLTFQVEDSACSSHPSIAHTDGNMEQVYKIAHSDQLNSILETAGWLGLLCEMCWQLWGRTWTCSRCPQCSCVRARNCWRQTWPSLSLESCDSRQNLGLLSWPVSQAAVLSVANAMLPPSKESQASQVKHQRYVCDLLGLWGHSSAGICPCLWLTSVTAEKFCSVWGRTCIEYVQNSGGTRSGWYTMTLCWHTGCGSAAISAAENRILVPWHSLLAWFGWLWFVLISKNEISGMSLLLWVCPWNSRRVADHLTCDSKNLVPVVFQSMAETFDYYMNPEGDYTQGGDDSVTECLFYQLYSWTFEYTCINISFTSILQQWTISVLFTALCVWWTSVHFKPSFIWNFITHCALCQASAMKETELFWLYRSKVVKC